MQYGNRFHEMDNVSICIMFFYNGMIIIFEVAGYCSDRTHVYTQNWTSTMAVAAVPNEPVSITREKPRDYVSSSFMTSKSFIFLFEPIRRQQLAIFFYDVTIVHYLNM